MDFPFRIPGTTEPEITIRRSAMGNVSVLVNGTKLKRRGREQHYDIPLGDGTSTDLEVKGQWRGLKVKVNGVETALEPPVSPVFVALVFLPLGLVLGGLIGGVIGLVASMANMVVSRRRLAAPLKLAAMVLIVAAGIGAFFAVGFAIAPLPNLATGDCLNARFREVQAGETVDTRNLRPVDCATAHENEVVGTIAYTDAGAFPGMQAFEEFAQAPCLAAFESYVGVSFEVSVLDMFILTPTDLTWIKGHRDIACIVMTLDGNQLTGTIRGTGR